MYKDKFLNLTFHLVNCVTAVFIIIWANTTLFHVFWLTLASDITSIFAVIKVAHQIWFKHGLFPKKIDQAT